MEQDENEKLIKIAKRSVCEWQVASGRAASASGQRVSSRRGPFNCQLPLCQMPTTFCAGPLIFTN